MSTETFIDPRDGHEYPLIKTSAGTWLGAYLAFNYPGSTANPKKDFRYYSGETAIRAKDLAPSGFVVPTFVQLIKLIGAEEFRGSLEKMEKAGFEITGTGYAEGNDIYSPGEVHIMTGAHAKQLFARWWNRKEYCCIANPNGRDAWAFPHALSVKAPILCLKR